MTIKTDTKRNAAKRPVNQDRISETLRVVNSANVKVTGLKVVKQGNSNHVRLTKDISERMGFEPGDMVHAVETPDGLVLRQYDPDFSRKMKAYRRTSKKFKNTLRELAK